MSNPFTHNATDLKALWHAARATRGAHGSHDGPPVRGITTAWRDLTGNGRDLAYQGTMGSSSASGWKGIGGALPLHHLAYDGVDDRATGAALGFGSSKVFSFVGWARPQQANGAGYIIGECGTVDTNHYGMLYFSASGGTTGPRFACKDGTTANLSALASVRKPYGEWQHVAVTSDGSLALVYQNGVEVGALTYTCGAWTAANLSVGCMVRSTPIYSSALIASARAYNVCLTPAEILHDFTLGRGAVDGYKATTALKADYHAALARGGTAPGTNGDGTATWHDRSGNGNHLTLSGYSYTESSGWVRSGRREEPHRLAFHQPASDPGTARASFGVTDRYVVFAARVYPREVPTWRNAFNMWENYLNRGSRFGFATDGSLRLWGTQSGGNIDCASAAGVITPGRWYTVGYAIDQTAGAYTVFVDGRIVATATGTHVAPLSTDTFNLGSGLNGEVAWAAVWGSASDIRPAADDAALAYCGGPTEWPMNEENPLLDGTLEVKVGTLDVTPHLLPGLGFSSSSPGGFGEATLILDASGQPFEQFNAQVTRGAATTVKHGATPVSLFEGQLTGDAAVGRIADKTATYELPAAGLYDAAKLREDYAATWVDTDLSRWYEGPRSYKAFRADQEGRLAVEASAGQTYKSGKGCSLIYWLMSGLGDSAAVIDHVELTCDDFDGTNGVDVNAANWYLRAQSATNPWATFTTERDWNYTTVAKGTVLRVPASGSLAAGTKALRLILIPTADFAPLANDRFFAFKAVRVFVRNLKTGAITSVGTGANRTVTTGAAHGLVSGDLVHLTGVAGETPAVDGYYVATVTGGSTFTIPQTGTVAGTGGTWCAAPRVDEVMLDIANDTGLATASDTAAVGNALTCDVALDPYTTRADGLEYVAAFHGDPFEWGFWDNGTFRCKPRVTPSGAAANRYLIDPRLAGIDYDVHAAGEGVPDYVRVLYSLRDVDGGTSTIPDGRVREVVVAASGVSPADPGWSSAGYRVALLDLSDTSMTTDDAAAAGGQYVAWLARNACRGEIVYRMPYIPMYDGGYKLAAYVRAGDFIAATGSPHGLLYISTASYDVDEGALTLTIGDDRWSWTRKAAIPRGGLGHTDIPALRRPKPGA